MIRDYGFIGRFLLLIFFTLVVSGFDLLSLVLLSDIVSIFSGEELRNIYFNFKMSNGELVIAFGFFLLLNRGGRRFGLPAC